MTPRRISLPLKDLKVDHRLQIRTAINPEYIGKLSEGYSAGDDIPPPIAFWNGAHYLLVDGFHRVPAAKDAGIEALPVDVFDGDFRAAMLWAVGPDNPNNDKARAQPITNADKRRKVTMLLGDPAWREWSNAKIAYACCVSAPYVGEIRRELFPDEGKPGKDMLAACPKCGRSYALGAAGRLCENEKCGGTITQNVSGKRKSLQGKGRQRKFTRKGKAGTMQLPPGKDKGDLAELKRLLDRGDELSMRWAEICHELGDARTAKAIGRAQQAAAAFRKRKIA